MHQKKSDLHQWIHACFDGCATADEVMRLNALLRESLEARDVYLQLADIHSCMAIDEKLWTEVRLVDQAKPQAQSRSGWLQWRPLTAAAAGVIIGALSATAVWAISNPNAPRSQQNELPLVDESFENTTQQVKKDMPITLGQWGGDPVEVVKDFGEIKPRSGRHMLRYLASATSVAMQETSISANLWQILELPGSGDRLVQIRAWFNASDSSAFTMSAVAGEEGVQSAHELWSSRMSEESAILAASTKRVTIKGMKHEWQMAEITMQVPDEARVLVLDVAAHRMPNVATHNGFPGQFVDDVSVSISDLPSLP